MFFEGLGMLGDRWLEFDMLFSVLKLVLQHGNYNWGRLQQINFKPFQAFLALGKTLEKSTNMNRAAELPSKSHSYFAMRLPPIGKSSYTILDAWFIWFDFSNVFVEGLGMLGNRGLADVHVVSAVLICFQSHMIYKNMGQCTTAMKTSASHSIINGSCNHCIKSADITVEKALLLLHRFSAD